MSDISQIFGGQSFNPQTVEPQDDFDVLPPGDYPVLITKTEFKANQKGTGFFIYLEMDIVDGPAKGQKVFDRLNIVNQNQKAVEIAMRTLSALCRACNIANFADTDQLLQQAVIACVKVKDNQNNVRTYKPIGAAGAVAPAAPVAPVPAPAPAPVYQQPATVPAAPVAPPAAPAMPAYVTPAAPVTVPPAVSPPVNPAPAPQAAPAAPTPPMAGVPPWQQNQTGG